MWQCRSTVPEVAVLLLIVSHDVELSLLIILNVHHEYVVILQKITHKPILLAD